VVYPARAKRELKSISKIPKAKNELLIYNPL